MPIDQDQIVEAILQQGWVQEVFWSEVIDSTNAAAKRWAAKDSHSLPALFVTDRQTEGRGRKGHAWWSPEGCLMFTLVLDSHSLTGELERGGKLALLCGVALANAVEHWTGGHPPQLKWPNDVYFHGKKLAGVLIESMPVPGDSGHHLWLIGVGLNVTVDWQQAPAELSSRATSISDLVQQRIQSGQQIYSTGGPTLGTVLLQVLLELQGTFQRWREQPEAWLGEWTERCCLCGRVVTVNVPGKPVMVGRCEGIDASGQLMVRTESAVHCLSVGEVVRWE